MNDSTRSSRCTYLFAGVRYDVDPLWSFLALPTFFPPQLRQLRQLKQRKQLKQLKLMFAHVQHAGLWLAPWRDRDNIKCIPGCSETTAMDSNTGARGLTVTRPAFHSYEQREIYVQRGGFSHRGEGKDTWSMA